MNQKTVILLALFILSALSCNLSDAAPEDGSNNRKTNLNITTTNNTTVSNTTASNNSPGSNNATTGPSSNNETGTSNNGTTSGRCGDDILQTNADGSDGQRFEECDGDDFGDDSCENLVPDSTGTLSCNEECRIVLSECLLPIENCSDLLQCITNCQGNQACFNSCLARSTSITLDDYENLVMCSSDSNCEDLACVEDNCPEDYDACFL